MLVALIIVAGALAGAIAGIAYLAVRWHSAVTRGDAAVDHAAATERQMLIAVDERNAAVAAEAQMRSERDDARAVAESAQNARNKSNEEEIANVKAKLEAGSAVDAAAHVRMLLSRALPGSDAARAVDSAEAGDPGDAEPAAMPLTEAT